MSTLSQLIASIHAVTLTFFVAKFVRHRRFYANLPGPPHSFLWGHVKIFGEAVAALPPECHHMNMITTIAQKYGLPGIFYIDLWPLGPEELVITDPAFAHKFVTFCKLPKHPLAATYLDAFFGPGNIVTTNGDHWKNLRDMLAPTFLSADTFRTTSLIADEVNIFHSILGEKTAAGQPILLERLISALAYDIMTTLIFGSSEKAQKRSDSLKLLYSTVQQEIAIRNAWNPFSNWRLRREKNATTNELNETLASKVRAHFDILKEQDINLSNKRTLNIVDLIFREVIQDAKARGITPHLDANFINLAVNNIKTLLFAGSGTTTDTLCFAFVLLSIQPETVAKLRDEHARVFASDIATIHSLLQTEPQRLKDLEYTTCVIKETLRLYPIGYTARAMDRPDPITYNGVQYPTNSKMIIAPVQHVWNMSKSAFPEPDGFKPERFLDIDKQGMIAWRAFERGSRACIGQALAMEEMKTVLLYTVQFFDMTCWGLQPNKEPRVGWTKRDLIFEDRAFQELSMEAKPRDGMPMVVAKVEY